MDIKKTHTTKAVLSSTKTGLPTPEVKNSDSVKISDQAKLLAEVGFYKKLIIDKVPDIRVDRVDEARERLVNGYYTSDKVLNSVSQTLSGFLVKDLEE